MNKKFGWWYDRDKYSLKELICNYCLMLGWAVGLLIQLINILVNKNYLIELSKGKIQAMPWIWDRLARFAFIWLMISVFAGVFKIVFYRQRKKGKLLSFNQTRVQTQQASNFAQAIEIKDKSYLYWITIGIILAIAIAVIMVVVWVV